MTQDTRSFEEIQQQIARDVAAARKGAVKQGEDVVGYWVPEGSPIVCTPRSAKLFDSKLDQDKTSMLIIVEISVPCAIEIKGNDGEMEGGHFARPGDIVGVWGKPGMRAIRECADVAGVVIELTGEKVVHKKKGMNPMKVYSVEAPAGAVRKLIPITEDARVYSANEPTFLDPKIVAKKPRTKTRAAAEIEEQAQDPDDDIDF